MDSRSFIHLLLPTERLPQIRVMHFKVAGIRVANANTEYPALHEPQTQRISTGNIITYATIATLFNLLAGSLPTPSARYSLLIKSAPAFNHDSMATSVLPGTLGNRTTMAFLDTTAQHVAANNDISCRLQQALLLFLDFMTVMKTHFTICQKYHNARYRVLTDCILSHVVHKTQLSLHILTAEPPSRTPQPRQRAEIYGIYGTSERKHLQASLLLRVDSYLKSLNMRINTTPTGGK